MPSSPDQTTYPPIAGHRKQAAMQILPVRQSDYHSYLLRLWHGSAQAPYHASLQCTATEQVYHFATVEALFAFLLTQVLPLSTDGAPCSPGDTDAD